MGLIEKRPEFHFVIIPENDKEYTALMTFQQTVAERLKGIAQVAVVTNPPTRPTETPPASQANNSLPDAVELDTIFADVKVNAKGGQSIRADTPDLETLRKHLESTGKSLPVGDWVYSRRDSEWEGKKYQWISRWPTKKK